MATLSSVQDNWDYHFHNSALLDEAFIAAGASASRNDIDGPKSGNKRLALVGDAALRLAVIDEWFDDGTSTADGQKKFLKVGTNERLANIAKKWKLKECVVENPCQMGGTPKELLAATVEAILGAVWMDSGGNLGEVQKVLKKLDC